MERIFAESVLKKLEQDFLISQEVMGTHFSGARLRIDAVIRPKDTSGWKNKDVALGIEFKLEEKLRSTKDKTHWIKQCIDYANTKWDSYGYLYVFSCPSIFDKLDYAVKGNQWLWNRVLSNLGVGRLDFDTYHGLTLYLQDTHRIWSENTGICSGKDWSLIRRFGRDSFKHL
jgi:hypothetical protein